MEYGLVIAVIAFLSLTALYGYTRGMVKIVLSMVAMIITIVLATILTVPVGAIVKAATPIYDNMYETVSETIEKQEITDIESLKKLDLPEQIIDKIIEEEDSIKNLEKVVCTEVTDSAFNAGVFLILLIVIYIAVKIAITMLDFVAKLPLLKEVNKIGGLAIGLIYGLVIVWAACLILTACSSKPWAQDIFAQINDNEILSFIYNNNLITWLVTKVL
jgi:uncharacterized membrane protein required for colicin V production